jgi:hypothetical protein
VSQFFRKWGSLDISQPYGHEQPVTGIFLPSFTSFIYFWWEIKIQITSKNFTAILANHTTAMATIWSTLHNNFGSSLLEWWKEIGNWQKSYITWGSMVESADANIHTVLRQCIQYEFQFLRKLESVKTSSRGIFMSMFMKELHGGAWRCEFPHCCHTDENFIKKHFRFGVHWGLNDGVCRLNY